MKKILLFLFICFIGFATGFAQNKISFQNLNRQSAALNGKFKSYQILEFNDDVQRISDGQQLTINLDQEYTFTIKENRILANNYTVSIKGENEISRRTLDEIGFDGQYFINEGISADNQLAFSIFEDRYSFYIKTASKEFYIEPLKNIDKSAASSQYVYYEVKNIIPGASFSCSVANDRDKPALENTPRINTTTGGCKTVGVVFLVDYTMYETYGTVSGAINRTLEMLNLSQINYTIANGLSDDVYFKVYEHHIITCDPCNLWPATLDIESNFQNLISSAYYYFFDNPQDKIRIYFQNEGGTGTIAGLATNYNCGLSGGTIVKNYAENADLTRNILSHELGHNFHCDHTEGHIMNWEINYTTTWAPESIVSINNSLNTIPCITDCNIIPCDQKKVADIAVAVDTDSDQVTISWLSEPGISYKVRMRSPSGWSDYTTLAYPTNSITYPISQLYCTDRYRVSITPQCETNEGIIENIMFSVSQNVAAPALVNWSGFSDEFWGPGSPYPVLCSGKTYTCSLLGIDGGTAPVYQWRVNGVNVGTNSDSLVIDGLQNNDVLSCELTSNATCVASPTAYFSTVVSVVDPVLLDVTLKATSNTTVCAGEAVTINQSVAENDYDYNGHLTLETYFNGNMIDLTNFIPLDPFSREFTFTPAESGELYCMINLSFSQNGVVEGCYLNNSTVSLPISITVIPQPCNLSVSDFEILGLSYYPNPVNSILTIESEETITDLTIYTILGQAVLSKTVNSDKTKLDLSALAPATYFLKIASKGKIINAKIIKE